QEHRASPLAHAAATIGGHRIEIRYGRPSMRERAIFGGIVPYGEVWRTGANEATHLRTPIALQVGDTVIPAGEYTLYSLPDVDRWTLIVNRQTGQWGTVYDPERDLARLPMRVESLADPVETFTITIGPGERSDGAITFEWERTRAVLPFDIAGG
ncbi:MAG: DUF2911 domain-containing protein, partial [Gemmatimonadota bacterium]